MSPPPESQGGLATTTPELTTEAVLGRLALAVPTPTPALRTGEASRGEAPTGPAGGVQWRPFKNLHCWRREIAAQTSGKHPGAE